MSPLQDHRHSNDIILHMITVEKTAVKSEALQELIELPKTTFNSCIKQHILLKSKNEYFALFVYVSTITMFSV